jgi:hypothetical protein
MLVGRKRVARKQEGLIEWSSDFRILNLLSRRCVIHSTTDG